MYGVRPLQWLLASVLVLGGLAAGPPAARAHSSPTAKHHQPTAERVCHQPSDSLVASCTAMVRTDLPPMASVPPNARPPGLSPQDLRRAYDLNGQRGRGRTVAITVAHHHPHLESDLAVYRRKFGLPPCTTASGCLRVVNQRGGSTLPPTVDPEWSFEEAIDVDMVSAACPDCRILVVEDDSAFASDMFPGVDQAVAQGAKFISNSWVFPEASFEPDFDFHFSNNPGVVFAFASGDNGGVTQYPAASPYVTAVGGTTLIPLHTPRGFGEKAWNGTGCGCSAFEPKPAFQHDAVCPHNRTIADVSAVADPASGVAVYTTSPTLSGTTGWFVAGGTSVASPLVASMYALAGNPAPGTFPNSYPYAHPQDFFDVTVGQAGTFSALPGYDAPTGIGTPDGVAGLRDPWGGGYGAA
ncbi:peptidase S8 [Streptomyces filipinensis]|uniref:Peptidase S8 n=1 Tax=Streptomyces filipinensis TaxID=66887 RepID=A0A918IIX1_9ACTN|nr:S53 family peptidase [Streptomyces filipinensis]GGV22185.1 peptidase S8 [Streptomyces filipinensis]